MKKKVLLVTSDFYNGLTDPFICPELTFLTKSFDVTVLSLENKKVEKDSLPTEYKFLSMNKYGKIKKITGVLTTVLSVDKLPDILTEIKQIEKSSLKLKIFIAHIHARANDLYNFIKSNYDVSDGEDIILYSYWYVPEILLAFLKLKNENSKIKIISRAHSGEIYEYMNEYNYLPYREKMIKGTDKIYFISDNGLNYFKKNYSLTDEICEINRLGVINNYGRSPMSENGILRIASCSYLHANKNVDKIIKAISLINDIKIEWVHFGDGPLLSYLTEFAKEQLEIKNNVKYSLMGRKTAEEIKEYYSNNPIDVFINVSYAEGVPVSIMEAMSAGIPIIATNVGGTSEIVNHLNGELIDRNITAENLAQKIINFMYIEDSIKEKTRESAFNTWMTKYNAEKNYLDFTSRLEELV